MPSSRVISSRVTAKEKVLIASACRQLGITESALIRRLIEAAVETAGGVFKW